MEYKECNFDFGKKNKYFDLNKDCIQDFIGYNSGIKIKWTRVEFHQIHFMEAEVKKEE